MFDLFIQKGGKITLTGEKLEYENYSCIITKDNVEKIVYEMQRIEYILKWWYNPNIVSSYYYIRQIISIRSFTGYALVELSIEIEVNLYKKFIFSYVSFLIMYITEWIISYFEN